DLNLSRTQFAASRHEGSATLITTPPALEIAWVNALGAGLFLVMAESSRQLPGATEICHVSGFWSKRCFAPLTTHSLGPKNEGWARSSCSSCQVVSSPDTCSVPSGNASDNRLMSLSCQ